jgi:uncharacterized paraquat-inducible protein A
MNKLLSIISLLAFLLISTTSYSQSSEKLRSIQKKADSTSVIGKDFYTCPVHSSYRSDKPGKCPQCGRTLIKKESVNVIYTCPNHPEVQSDHSGVCPKCGTKLIKKERNPKDAQKLKYQKG